MSLIAKSARKSANVTTTTNGAKAFKSTNNANLDFFAKAGNIEFPGLVPAFQTALNEDIELALRNLLHMRDIRGDTGGYGVRKNFRILIKWLSANKPEVFKDTRVLKAIPVVGRWDDLFELVTEEHGEVSRAVVKYLGTELMKEVPDGLLCKWLPKKGVLASKLRSYVKLDPKAYRQRLVKFRNVLETKMCERQWSSISYDKIPSKAGFIYRNAFRKQDGTRYEEFLNKAASGEIKINTGTLYPHEVLGAGIASRRVTIDKTKEAMWKNLPDFLPEGKSILPMIDVSGSMDTTSYGKFTCMDMSVALGMYLSSHCKGPFKNLYMTFDSTPRFGEINPNANLETQIRSVVSAPWGGSTNVEAAFKLLLDKAVKVKASQEDMPSHVIVLTDGQFDQMNRGSTTFNSVKAEFKAKGYELPTIVFWNLNARYGNQPVKAHTSGAVLVSGYSPSILQSVLSGEEVKEPTPFEIMMIALTSDRYNVM